MRHVLIAGVLLAITPAHSLQAQGSKKAPAAKVNFNDLYKTAVDDYNAGRYLESEAKFRKILARHPNHIQSQRYRAMLKKRVREMAAVPMMKRRLNKLSLKAIEFEEATLAEVMEFVTRKTKEVSKGKVTPGLVIRGGDEVRDRKLTFKIGSVPIDTLIDTAAKLTNTTVKYSDYAITFTPLPTAEDMAARAAKQLERAEAKERARAARATAENDPFNR